ncbi:MAG: ATP-binding cassette domain-containing protein [Treponema sp.]|nr:ATP-binding cassette domain-containing protein [Treponema sp.]
MNVIEIRNISKQYPNSGKKANNDISLDLKKAEILCVAGENGAGKTTLMKILCGLEKQDTGDVKICGNVGMVHQHFMLFPEFTVAENIVIGKEPRKWRIFTDNKKACQISEKIIKENNFSIKANVKVKELTLGEMQQVEICRILYRNADIIILDEPTSILTELEIKSLFITLKNLANNGKSIILITHKLHEIKQISDRAAILRHGELKGICNVCETSAEEISNMMIGETAKKDANTGGNQNSLSPAPLADEKIIAFKNVTVRRQRQKLPLLDNVSFSVSSGEILGFAGVGGNGLGVIEAVLGGFLHPVSGKIYHKEKDITRLNIRALRRQGLTYVPADRIRVGSAAGATIEENIIINKRNKLLTDKIIKKYNIDAVNRGVKASTLSGGNLQKLILAREINSLKDYIVFSNPAWGLDIESSRFVMNEIKELKKKGAAVILISTDLDEIITLSDRIIVMYKGKIAGEYENNKEPGIKEKIGKSMQGIIDNEE